LRRTQAIGLARRVISPRGVVAWIVLVLVLVVAGAVIGRHRLFVLVGETLVCEDGPRQREAVLIDNFDYEFGLFRLGAELERTGVATRVIVPVTSPDGPDAIAAARQVADTFARMAGLQRWDVVAAEHREPISLTTASRVRDYLVKEHISEVTLVSAWFRSRRSELIYRTVLRDSGISMRCMPVYGGSTPQTWTRSWHGVQDVVEQFAKLQYYRFWVLPKAS
jgi:hypothetical protein